MITNLKLKDFRSFDLKEFEFSENINLIFGNNGKGKSNILEAIKLVSRGETISSIPFENLVKNNSNEGVFFVRGIFKSKNISDIAYDKKNNKKKIFLNGKVTTKKNLQKNTFPIVSFSPIDMNIMYLSPSLRRNFLINTLKESEENFSKDYKSFEHILKNRNSVLKNIREKKANKNELNFWDEQYIGAASKIYIHLEKLINFYEENILDENEFFLGKFNGIKFKYTSEINFNDIENSVQNLLTINNEKDIILGRTSIGPHSDDFDILIDGIKLVNIASRGETKSVFLGLKFLELKYIEEKTNKKAILLIDDLISELDDIHKKMLLERIKNNQSIIANIFPIEWEECNIIKL